jgi:hypothetical protein
LHEHRADFLTVFGGHALRPVAVIAAEKHREVVVAGVGVRILAVLAGAAGGEGQDDAVARR